MNISGSRKKWTVNGTPVDSAPKIFDSAHAYVFNVWIGDATYHVSIKNGIVQENWIITAGIKPQNRYHNLAGPAIITHRDIQNLNQYFQKLSSNPAKIPKIKSGKKDELWYVNGKHLPGFRLDCDIYDYIRNHPDTGRDVIAICRKKNLLPTELLDVIEKATVL